jgi:AcrR family transcriptional regulator
MPNTVFGYESGAPGAWRQPTERRVRSVPNGFGSAVRKDAADVTDGREDRRVRRTRRLLRGALLALVAEKGYDRVTVQHVLDRADVGRATFYAHFRDKDDLLLSGFDELREAIRSAMARYERGDHAPPIPGLEMTRALFEHVAAHRALYRGLAGGRAGALVLGRARAELVTLVRAHFERVAAQQRAEPTVALEVLAEHTVGALLGVLTWWLEHPSTHSPQEMAATFERLATPTVHSGLGLHPRANGILRVELRTEAEGTKQERHQADLETV